MIQIIPLQRTCTFIHVDLNPTKVTEEIDNIYKMVNILMSNNCTGKHLTMYKIMRPQMILQVCVKKIFQKWTVKMIWSTMKSWNNFWKHILLLKMTGTKYKLIWSQNIISSIMEKMCKSFIKMLERFINNNWTNERRIM